MDSDSLDSIHLPDRAEDVPSSSQPNQSNTNLWNGMLKTRSTLDPIDTADTGVMPVAPAPNGQISNPVPLSNGSSVRNSHSVSLNIRSKLLSKVHAIRRQQECSDDEEHREEASVKLSDSSDSDIENISTHSFKIKRNLSSIQNTDEEAIERRNVLKRLTRAIKKCKCTFKYTIDPHGSAYLYWLGLIFFIYTYNILSVSLRATFPFVQGTNFTPIGTLRGPPEVQQLGLLIMWLLLDILMDILYIVDMMFVRSHLKLTDEDDSSQVKMKNRCYRYVHKWHFWVDLVSLVPLEILYIVPVLRFNVLLRIPRLLRVHHVYIFYDQFESSTKYPHAFRLMKMVGYLLLTVHIYACIYYAVSARTGFGANTWVYNGEGNGYLRCFYWALMTVATIHDLNERIPTSNLEYFLGAFGHLIGVFILAVVIGEITNIVEAANLQRQLFRDKQDQLKQFMQIRKIPQELQNKVKQWTEYTFTYQQMTDEDQVLESLPKKMRSDIAIQVHFDALSKVKIFQGFEETLLRELVLKLHSILIIPGEFICKKGEIGREMYIVNQGMVQVMGGADDDLQLLAELGPGSIFGEISLLQVGGGNRRTAHVRSKGFSNLFVLSKKDLHETLIDYPSAQKKLKQQAKILLRQDKKRTSETAAKAATTKAAAAFLSVVPKKRRIGTVEAPEIIHETPEDTNTAEATTTVAEIHPIPKDTVSSEKN